jgi:tetratricopeptide (TPR) repeat protein
MTTKELLRDVLQAYLDETKTGPTRLASLSKVPRKTINHWLSGHVLKPRQWQDLVRVAQALHLDEAQTDRLLLAGGHARVRSLLAQVGSDDRALLLTLNGHARTPTVAPPAPFRAPADLPTFVGRADQVRQLREALLQTGQAAICGVKGMGGVGKTTLATRIAYQLRTSFPDGVLWARLDVTDTLTILASFADAYDKDVSQFRDIESRAAVVRDLLVNKRVLIILDNAESGVQVRPLLPPNSGKCAVLVTTRNDLSALDGWKQVALGSFDSASPDALQLFERYLGPSRVSVYEDVLREISSLLGHLPLALAIAAGLLAWQLRDVRSEKDAVAVFDTLRADLRREEVRLSRLRRDDQNVFLSFGVSFRALNPDLQSFFAQLSVFGGQDFGVEAAAYVAEASNQEAQDRLDALVARSLVQPSSHGRFRLHPLLRDYARLHLETLTGQLSAVKRRALEFFAAGIESGRLGPSEMEDDASNIMRLLDGDFESPYAHAMIRLSQAFYPYTEARGLFMWAKHMYVHACKAAEALGDDAALATSLRALSSTVLRLSEFDDVIDFSTRGIDVARRIGDDELAIRLLNNIGSAHFGRGHYVDALRVGREALAIARAINHRPLIAGRLITIGTTLAELGDVEQGRQHLVEGKAMAEASQDYISLLVALINLSEFEMGEGRYESSIALLIEGIALARQLGQRERLANLLINLGNVRSMSRDFGGAELAIDEGLKIAQELAMPWMISLAQCTRADHLTRLGQLEAAASSAQEALSAGERIGSDHMMANALFSLAKIRALQGRRDEANSLARESLELFSANQSGRTAEVQAWLASQ